MAPKKKPTTLNVTEHVFDVHKTLAERLAKQRREEEFGSTPCSNDSILTLPTFSDSMMEGSQETPTSLNARQNLHRLVTLDVFSGPKLCLFDEAQVKFSWLDPNSLYQLEDIELDNPSSFILSEFKALEAQRFSPKSALISRYLLLLLSVTGKKDVLDACTGVLQEHISSKQFNVPVPDFVAILVNYGAPIEKLWPSNWTLQLPFNMKTSSSPCDKISKLPIQNFASLLNLLFYNLKISPQHFTVQEKIGLFNLFLNLSMDKTIIKARFILELLRSLITRLLDCFTQEEWASHDSALVEELVLCSFNDSTKLDVLGLVQRVDCIGNISSRTAQTQQACAFFALQECLPCLSRIVVAGEVLVDDVLGILGKVEKFPANYEVAYCLVKAVSYCIDVTHPSSEMKKILELASILNDWRHTIQDVSVDCDTNRLAVKDLITELTYQWKIAFPVDSVV